MSKKYKLKLSFIIGVIGMMFFLGACKTTRKIIRKPIKEQGAIYLFDKLSVNELKFDYLNAKFSLHLRENKKKTSFRGQIRIKKDSLIWVSFSPLLGIEAARLLITNDSVKFINRLKKTYFCGDYTYLNECFNTNIDFNVLQGLIIGNDFNHYENEKFRASIDDGLYRLSTAARHKLKKYVRKTEAIPNAFIQNIWLCPYDFKIIQHTIKEIKKENKKLQVNYYDFTEINSQLFPKSLKFNLQAENKIEMVIDYSKITVNKKINLPFKIPRKYKSISDIK
jgi:hypothetical protein